MRKKILAGILALTMAFTLVPSNVLAEENVTEQEAVTLETETTEETVESTEADTEALEDSTETELSIEDLQERINFLPTVEEFQVMSNEEKNTIYETAQNLVDEYEGLSQEDQGQIDISKLEALFEYSNSQVSVMAEYSYDPSVNYAKYDENTGLTVTFTMTSGLGKLYDWVIFLFDPDKFSSVEYDLNHKLLNSGNMNLDEAEYAFSTGQGGEDYNQLNKVLSVTADTITTDLKNSGKTLEEVWVEKDWVVVLGPHRNWSDPYTDPECDAYNPDYYVGSQQEIQSSSEVAFDYNGYPYGIINDSSITLTTALEEGTANDVQWYRSTSTEKDGEYEKIEGATDLTYQFTASTGTAYWYKCKVNGTDTEPVQVIYSTPSSQVASDTTTQLGVYSQRGMSAWYISNGSIAYTSGSSKFDVVGSYLYAGSNSSYAGKEVWISTSYSGGWKWREDSNIDKVICTFNKENAHSLECEAKLKNSVTQIGLYADVCLGSSTLFSNLADGASLKAVINNGRATQLQMVSASTVDDATESDAAFVLEYIDEPSTFYLGYYSNASYNNCFSYNNSPSSSDGVKDTQVVNGTSVVTEVAGVDSGAAMSWSGITNGTVHFNFNIGSVAQAGAQIKANSEVTSTTVVVTQEEGNIGDYEYNLYDKTTGEYVSTEWKTPGSDGKVKFEGLTPNHTYEIKYRKTTGDDKTEESAGDTTTAIDPLNPGGTTEGGETKPEVKVEKTNNGISFENLSTSFQYRLLDENDNDVTGWKSTTDGNLSFTGLKPGTKYYLVAKTSSNSQTDKVEYITEKVKITYNNNVEDTEIAVPEEQEFADGDALSTFIPERTGYDFIGWNLAADKNSTSARYRAGQSVTDIYDSVTLYACWKLKTFSIKPEDTDQYTVEGDSAEYGKDYTFVISPKDGYILKDITLTVDGEVLPADCIKYDSSNGTYTCTIKNVTEQKDIKVTSCDYTSALEEARKEAEETLTNEVNDRLEQINNLTNLTEEQKKSYKEKIESVKNEAFAKMDSLTDPTADKEIGQIKASAEESLASILNDAESNDASNAEELSNAKKTAIEEINAEADAAKAAIDELTDLTEEEKTAFKNDVDSKAADAKKNVNSVTFNEKNKIEDYKELGLTDIIEKTNESVEKDLSNAKEKAVSAIEQKAETAKETIDAMSDLTEEEKQAAKAEINSATETAKAAIEKVTNPSQKDEVAEKQDTDFAEVEKVLDNAKKTDFSNAKENAKADIDRQAETAKEAIDAMPNLTDEEKKVAKAEVDKKADEAKAEIESVTDVTKKDNVTGNKTTGFEELEKVVEESANNDLSNLKEAVKVEIDRKAEEAKDAIDEMEDLTPEEKEAAKAEVDKKAEAAKAEIDNVTDLSKKDDIENQKNTNFGDVDKITEDASKKDLSNAKESAKAEIDKKAEIAKEAIDAMPNLTDEEKEEAKAKIEKEAEEAKKAVEKVTDPVKKDLVESKKNTGFGTIEKTEEESAKNDLSNLKEAAKVEIDRKAEAAKEAIDEMTDLTPEQKETAKAAIDVKADAAKNEIDKVTDPSGKAEVENQKDTSFDNVDEIVEEAANTDLSNAKESAKAEIDEKAETAKEAIDAMSNLTAEEKEAAKAEVDKKAAEAKAAVENVTNPAKKDLVGSKKNTGFGTIEKTEETSADTDLSREKESAKAEIDTKAEEAKAAIDAMSDLTAEEKEAAKAEIDKKAADAKTAIDNVTNPSNKDEVKNQKDVNFTDVDKITNEALDTDLSNAKDTAKAELDKKADEAKAAIDAMTDLTAEEKESAKAEIDKEAETAKKAIDGITDPVKKSDITGELEAGAVEISKKNDAAENQNASNAVVNKEKAEEAEKKANTVINDIKVSATDKDTIKNEIKKELEKEGLTGVDVDINDFNKVPATLDEDGRITGTAVIEAGGTKKTVTIDKELPKLSSFVSYECQTAEDAPKASAVVDEKTLMKKVLTQEQIAVLANGGTSDIKLHIESKEKTVSNEDKKLVENVLADTEKVGAFIDISLLLTVTDAEGNAVTDAEKIHEPDTVFTITVTIPEKLRAEGRTYQMVRVHDGVAEILSSVYDEKEQTLTFKTDRFSTYAIIYNEESGTGNGGNGNNDKNNNIITDVNTKDSSNTVNNAADNSQTVAAPKTGDSDRAMMGITLLLIAMVGLAGVFGKRRKESM